MKCMLLYRHGRSDILNTVYTVKEVASILKLSVRTLYTLIEKGDIKTVRIGNSVRITSDELKRITKGE